MVGNPYLLHCEMGVRSRFGKGRASSTPDRRQPPSFARSRRRDAPQKPTSLRSKPKSQQSGSRALLKHFRNGASLRRVAASNNQAAIRCGRNQP
jgi:hypothetical protein